MNGRRSRRSPLTAPRYFANAVVLTVRQDGWWTGVVTASRLLVEEVKKVPRSLRLKWQNGDGPRLPSPAPIIDMPKITRELAALGVEVRRVGPERTTLERHLHEYRYPRIYAGGSVTSGGARESKILEYFLSLMLLPVVPSDVVVDVASERSVFPDVVATTVGARVFRLDIIYPPGIHGDRIGGSADGMPLPDGSVDKLFLHNSFEHFEGDIDTGFVREAWRVLRRGGGLCVVPLYLSARHQIVTDPLVDRTGVEWDPDAEVVERVGHRNRFGRFYSPATLAERVLRPAFECGFGVEVCAFDDSTYGADDGFSSAQRGINFAMVLRKPGPSSLDS